MQENSTFQVAQCPESCVYCQTINGNMPFCAYLLETNQMRGCDPGPGCKRYVAKSEKPMGNKYRQPGWDTAKGRAMWEAGRTDTEIAKALGVKRDTVSAFRKRNWGERNGAGTVYGNGGRRWQG